MIISLQDPLRASQRLHDLTKVASINLSTRNHILGPQEDQTNDDDSFVAQLGNKHTHLIVSRIIIQDGR